jgi:hypothetical protein
MEPQDYSAFADLLNKFHTATPLIQALWLLVVSAMILGVTGLAMRTLRDIAAMRTPSRRETSKSLLVYGVVQDEKGQWHVIRHGAEPKPLDWTNPPRELVGRVAELD